ncbi:GntR family transcriptional regulator [Pedomonas sp. V897]|uniref:GntR family transcriptional regulator n=1 Tax=Pedomonas sp. V897 TaxID=3446482 RepID=UPI003EDEA92C
MSETLSEAAHIAELTGQPLYLQIAADLRARITSQEFAAGTYLPTEEKLCAHYQVSRFTIREALRQLQQEGLISRRRGAGTLIRHDGAAPAPVLDPQMSACPEPAPMLLQPGRFGGATTLAADERLAQRLGCAVGSRWAIRSAVCASPTMLVEIFLPERLKQLAGQIQPGHEPVWQQLKALGEPPGRVRMKAQSVTPHQSEARLLGVAALSPCLRITYACLDLRDELMACAVHLYPGHCYTYESDILSGSPCGDLALN